MRQALSQPRFWLAVALVAFAMVDLHRLAAAGAGVDFYPFWVVAQQARHERLPDIYQSAVRRQIGQTALGEAQQQGGRRKSAAEFDAQIYPDLIEPISTPWFYVVTSHQISSDYERDLDRFQLFSNLAGLAGLLILCRLSGLTWIDSLLAAAAVILCFSPIRDDVTHANMDRVQLFLLCVPLLVLWRWPSVVGCAATGVILGLASLYKPNIAAVVPLLLVSRLARREMPSAIALAVGTALGAIAAVIMGAGAFAGSGSWLSWWRCLRTLDYPLEMGNCGGGKVLFEFTGLHLGAPVLVVLFAVTVVIIWRTAATKSAGEDLFAVAAGCLLMIVSSSLAWVHYFVFALPMGLYLLRPPRQAATIWDVVRQGLACVALACMARIPIQAVFGLTSQRQLAAGYVLASAALLGLGLFDRHKG